MTIPRHRSHVLSTTRALLLATLVALLVVGATALPATPATAQSLGSLELVAQSSWVDEGGIFNAQVRVAAADPEASVTFRVFPAWEQRTDFRNGTLREDAEPLVELEPIMLSEAQETSNEVLSIELEVSRRTNLDIPQVVDPELVEELPRPQLTTDGEPAVYPLEVTLLSPDGTSLDSFLTSIIYLPRFALGQPLATSLILQPAIGPSILPDGTSTLTETDIEGLGVLVEAISQHPDGKVALSITGETLLSLERSELAPADEILTSIRERFTDEQLLPRPFTNLEEQAWIDANLTAELAELYETNSTITNEITGLTPVGSVILVGESVSADGLSALRNLGAEGVIVQDDHVTPLDRSIFPDSLSTRFLIPTPNRAPVPAMALNSELAEHFADAESVPFTANRLLGDLTMLALEYPNLSQGVVITPPEGWVPDERLLNVVLSGLERIPLLTGASPVEVLSTTSFASSAGVNALGSPLQRELDPRTNPANLRSYRTEFSQAEATIDSWSTVIVGDMDSVDRLHELLELSANGAFDTDQQLTYIDEIYRVIDTQRTDSITTQEADTFTLTGRNSDVPVVVNNNLDMDAAVLLLLDSEKLGFPEGREIEVVLTPGSNRIEVPIEALASGDSPIRIQVFSPDRTILLGSSEILVRTFAFSGVGVIIGTIAIAVLLLWWLRHRKQARGTVNRVPAHSDSPKTEEPIGV